MRSTSRSPQITSRPTRRFSHSCRARRTSWSIEFFEGAENDMVVPEVGVYEPNGCDSFPIADERCLKSRHPPV